MMGAKPVTAISGIGTRTAARLGELGIVTVADLAASDHHELARRFGPTIGPYSSAGTGRPRRAFGRRAARAARAKP